MEVEGIERREEMEREGGRRQQAFGSKRVTQERGDGKDKERRWEIRERD